MFQTRLGVSWSRKKIMPKPQLIGHAIPPDSEIFVYGTGSCRNRFGVDSALRASPDNSLRSLDEIYWAIKAIFHKLDCSEKDQHQVDHESFSMCLRVFMDIF